METNPAVGGQLGTCSSTVTSCNSRTSDVEKPRKSMKNNRRRSSSSLTESSSYPNEDHSSTACAYCKSSPLSAQFAEMSIKQSSDGQCASSPMQSSLGLSPSQNTKYQREEGSSASLKSRQNGQGTPWQWLRIRKGIKTKKVVCLRRRPPIDETSLRLASKGKYLQDQVPSSEEGLLEETQTRPVSQNIINGSFDSACLNAQSCQHPRKKESTMGQSSISLGKKYQPKLFEDVAGHEIVVKALSNAVQKEKISPLYLFHGPSGTGKTSTARILAMALNCESSTHSKPCWSCRGCTRSLYMMDLCSGSRISGFERIRTLMQNTTFTQVVTGFKVFIIEECHSLTTDAWEEISTIVERGSDSSVVFVMVTEDVNMVPRIISSRCQKFSFPKLKDTDITLKLARIVARENIGIEREALKLIISKADGSMREAENILDQLALLGSRITSPMVQQIVGLVPHNKLLELLRTVLCADTIKTVRSARELIASGVQPQSLLSQLASIITDILSGTTSMENTSSPGSSKDKRLLRTGSQLTNDQSERLSHALKMLVETEKDLSSSNDHTNWLVASLLEIASEQVPSRISSGIVLPRDIVVPPDCKLDSESRQNAANMHKNGLSYLLHQSKSRKHHHPDDRVAEELDINANNPSSTSRSTSKTKRGAAETVEEEPNLRQVSNVEEVWQNMLGRIQSGYVKEFLTRQGKLASLTISSANAIVHLLFKRPEDKLAAQMSEEIIIEALEMSLGCPVIVNMSLDPMQLEIEEGNNVSTTQTKLPESSDSRDVQTSAPFYPAFESPSSSKAAMSRSKSQKSSLVPEKIKPVKLQGNVQTSQGQAKYRSGRSEGNKYRPQQILPFSGSLSQGNLGGSAEHENVPPARDESPGQMTNVVKPAKSKHRWLSLSSIQQADASVERYSQDLLFEENSGREKGKRRSLRSDVSRDTEDQPCEHGAALVKLNRSWSCSEIFCRKG